MTGSCNQGNEHTYLLKCENFLTNYEMVSFSRRATLFEFNEMDEYFASFLVFMGPLLRILSFWNMTLHYSACGPYLAMQYHFSEDLNH
jgi:hypothetical protein